MQIFTVVTRAHDIRLGSDRRRTAPVKWGDAECRSRVFARCVPPRWGVRSPVGTSARNAAAESDLRRVPVGPPASRSSPMPETTRRQLLVAVGGVSLAALLHVPPAL